MVLVASYSYWYRASVEWSYWWREVGLVASGTYWWRVVPTGGELLVLVASQWRVVLLVANGPSGGEWYWWRTTRTGGEPVASGHIGGEWYLLVASYSYWYRASGEWSY